MGKKSDSKYCKHCKLRMRDPFIEILTFFPIKKREIKGFLAYLNEDQHEFFFEKYVCGSAKFYFHDVRAKKLFAAIEPRIES